MNLSGGQSRVARIGTLHDSGSRVLVTVGIVTYLLLSGFLMIFFPPFPILAHLLLLLGAFVMWRWPVGLIAFILFLTPFQPLTFLALKAMGFDWVILLSSLKEIGMLGACCVLAWRNGLKLTNLDFLLLSLFGWATLISLARASPFTWIGLKDDFDFVIPFYAGRLILLDERWIKSALWLGAVVAAIGLVEFFFVGIEGRMLLLGLTDPTALEVSFNATYFSGFRAASTLASPLEFGGFCATVLLVFASYCRHLSWIYVMPAIILAGGMIVSLTRMSWLAVLVGLVVIAICTGQKLRLLIVVGISALVMLLVVVPLLQLEDFVSSTRKGYDPSLDTHFSSVKDGASFILSHPMGVGAGLVGPRAVARKPNALTVESAFLQYGMAYGWLGFLLFTTFWVGILMKLWKNSSAVGVGAAAVAFGMCSMLLFSTLHMEFGLNSWVFTLLGCGVHEALGSRV